MVRKAAFKGVTLLSNSISTQTAGSSVSEIQSKVAARETHPSNAGFQFCATKSADTLPLKDGRTSTFKTIVFCCSHEFNPIKDTQWCSGRTVADYNGCVTYANRYDSLSWESLCRIERALGIYDPERHRMRPNQGTAKLSEDD